MARERVVSSRVTLESEIISKYVDQALEDVGVQVNAEGMTSIYAESLYDAVKLAISEYTSRMGVESHDPLRQAASLIIETLGDDPQREGLVETPRRFSDAFMEDFLPNGTPEDALGEMVMEERFDQLTMVKNIPIRSFCEHHILPWFGKVTVGYIPHSSTVGLSKMTRMVASAGKGLTIQERVTDRLANAMETVLEPKGAMVIIEAVHTCTLLRGVKTELQTFTTSAAKGVFLNNPASRQEFLTLYKD